MIRLILLAGLGLCLAVGAARGEEAATEQLIRQLAGIQQMQGRFSQTQYGPDSAQPSGESSGNFRLLKPSYFAWEISQPDSQLVIADGQHLWHHDRDLETVTRRPLDGDQAATPLQVLGGDAELLRRQFAVSNAGEGRYLLKPSSGDPGFRELTLVFARGRVGGMEIVDKLGQRLSVRFADVDTESQLTPEDFSFTPPAGADLFYHDQ